MIDTTHIFDEPKDIMIHLNDGNYHPLKHIDKVCLGDDGTLYFKRSNKNAFVINMIKVRHWRTD